MPLDGSSKLPLLLGIKLMPWLIGIGTYAVHLDEKRASQSLTAFERGRLGNRVLVKRRRGLLAERTTCPRFGGCSRAFRCAAPLRQRTVGQSRLPRFEGHGG